MHNTDERKRIFFSAGEPSGDLHAAELIEAIKNNTDNVDCVGFGGPKMREAGCELLHDMTSLAVMWIARALWNIRKFIAMVDEADAYFAANKVDVVVLVDFPGFNWWIARRAKKRGIPVVYFMPPQIWSWATWRIKKMKRLIDYIFCSLPFEKRWFDGHGCNVVYVGHPFFEEVRNRTPDMQFIDDIRNAIAENEKIVTLLPGSRNQEVHGNFDDFLSTALKICSEMPNVKFFVAAFKDAHKEWMEQRLKERNVSDITICVGKTPELIKVADCCLAVSGSVSLELLANNKPSIIYYKVSQLGLFVQRFFRRSRYITLTNLLAVDREDELRNDKTVKQSIFYTEFPIPKELSAEDQARAPFPEFLTAKDRSDEVSRLILSWLRDAKQLETRREELAALLKFVDNGESTVSLAADFLMKLCENHGSGSD